MPLFDVQFCLPRLPADATTTVLPFVVEAINATHAVQLVNAQYPKTAWLAEVCEVRDRRDPVVFRGVWHRPAPFDDPFRPDDDLSQLDSLEKRG